MSDDLIRRMQVLANDMERSAPEEWDEHEDVMEAADYIARLTAELAEARAEKEAAYAVGFAAGIEAAAKSATDGCDRKHATIFRADGVKSKHDQCRHGVVMYEDCIACEIEAIRALTAPDTTQAAARVLLADTEAGRDGEIGPWLRAVAEGGERVENR